ncbi:hypothetical protein AD942_00655 [Gluconobacter japonicus]|uniref:hypothetical protein n=1 Tax=Gluconobacter japonicus TaxID=376620 RepID=UPI000786391D|nr:hypothetical protein [Gluconobacter japonicus]KXV30385.1 hypothetical protein AD936_17105 [Gluconobacter japonicus]KXV42002.1 hypothetical protein AD942_00655 [Gluconobacter japonicus]
MDKKIKSSESTDQDGKKGWIDFARNMLLSICSLFFGSFLFSGLIEGYKDDLSSKRAIVTEQFRPMRETTMSCHNLHNKLVLAYADLAGSYGILLHEMKRIGSEGDALDPDYERLMNGILATRIENARKVESAKNDTDSCYNKLFRQDEELSIVTASHDDFQKIWSSHTKKINDLLKERENDNHRIIGNTDSPRLWENFAHFFGEREHDKSNITKFINENPKLFSIPIEFNSYMSKSETGLLREMDAVAEDVDTLFSKKINDLFREGFFHRLFRLI